MAHAAGTIKTKFLGLLQSLTPEDVAKDPSRDFSRARKLPVQKTILSLVLLGKDCLDTEMRRLFREMRKTPCLLSSPD